MIKTFKDLVVYRQEVSLHTCFSPPLVGGFRRGRGASRIVELYGCQLPPAS